MGDEDLVEALDIAIGEGDLEAPAERMAIVCDDLDGLDGVRELERDALRCKAALEAQALNPEDGMTYFVLAQCYGAQASGANFTSQAMYWVAYDTMEKAAQLLEEADLKETATKMMAAFRSAWPSKEECFFNEVQAGQRYVVNGIATTVRCIR